MFLRGEHVLPDEIHLRQIPFCNRWGLVKDFLSPELDAKIRGVGWHFMWLSGSCSRRGIGYTEEEAIHGALVRALGCVARRFNAAELESVQVTKWPGFRVAKVELQPRQIQQLTSLDAGDGIILRPVRVM